ncbi:MAG TPA: hypothetical protein VLW17_10220 [Thermoanaerobaculaceae bacterium]|nr:hypothetical protein [Thermoanaerobaculaceae bacterium]
MAPLLVAVTIVATAIAKGSARPTPAGGTRLPHHAGDVLLLRDGSRKTGALKGCGGPACLLDSTPIPREQIEWIGLGAIPPPPQLADPGADAVFLAGGGQKAETMLGITTQQVSTDAGSYPRAQVRWIHLAPPGGEGQSTPTPIVAATPSITPPPTPTSTPTNTPSPTPTSTPTPTRTPSRTPPGEAVQPCPAAKPLGARIQVDVDRDTIGGNRPGGCRYRTTTKLWAELVPPAAPPLSLWPHPLAAAWATTRLSYEVSSEGCSDVPGDNEECSAPGASKSGEVRVGEVVGGMYRGLPAVGYLDFEPTRPDLRFLPPDALTTAEQPLACVGLRGGGGSRGSLAYRALPFEIAPRANCGRDPLVFCANPTGCYGATDPALRRDCIVHADRHAVVPFSGEASSGSGGTTGHVRWDVCCGCGEKPSGPPPEITPRPPEEKKDCCEELALARGKMRGLADAARAHEKDYEQSEARRQKLRDEIWGAGGSLFKFSNALLGVATKGVEGAWGKILGLAAAVISNEQDHTAFSNFGVAVEIAANPNFFAQSAINHATAVAEQTLNETGDLAQAQRVYLEQLKEACESMEPVQERAEVLSIGAALIDFSSATRELADGLSEYAEAAEDTDRAKEDWDKTLEQMDEVQQEITALLACCPGGAAGAGGAAAVAPRAGVEAASFVTSGRLRLAAARAAAPAADTPDKLRQLQAAVAKTGDRIARSLLPPLAPFASGRWRQANPKLLVGLVKAAEPELRAILDEAERERTTGQRLNAALASAGQPAAAPAPAARTGRRLS